MDGPTRQIPLNASGNGTTIVADPPMSPTLNLGPHFCKTPCRRTFRLTNQGRRHQSLVWSSEGLSFTGRPRRSLPPVSSKDMKYKVSPVKNCVSREHDCLVMYARLILDIQYSNYMFGGYTTST